MSIIQLQQPLPIRFSTLLALGSAFSTDDIKAILTLFEEKTYPTHALLVGKETHNYLMFLETGLVREFSVIGAEQESTHTHHFWEAGRFYFSIQSFLPCSTASYDIEVLEKANIWRIQKDALEELFAQFPALRNLMQLALVDCLKKYDDCTSLLRQPAEQRLSYFYEKNPQLANRVPLKYLASYLNITPTHLSRIRRKLAIHPR